MLVDSHCHLDYPQLYEQLDDVLKRAEKAGIGRIVTISTQIGHVEHYKALAEHHKQIFFTIGTHPHSAAEEPDIPVSAIAAHTNHPRCIGIGEAGLDYHYDFAPRDIQQKVFRTHIAAARETGLPLVVHAREADDDMISIFREEMEQGAFMALLHCFSSTEKLAEAGIDLGFYFSFSGILTYKKADEVRRLASMIPNDRVLVETDAPYLAPVPFRSKTNEPSYIVHTARVLADIKGVSEQDIADITTDNFYRLFQKAAREDKR